MTAKAGGPETAAIKAASADDTPGRTLKLSVSASTGTFNRFLAWINGVNVINTDGQDKDWEGIIGSDKAHVHVRAWGIGAAKYTVGIDLPGTADDQELECTLSKGFHETEITI
jgi:hypothetical protein